MRPLAALVITLHLCGASLAQAQEAAPKPVPPAFNWATGAIVPQEAHEPPRLGIFVVDDADGSGLVVDEVIPGTPAARARIQKGDRIVRFGDTPVCRDADLLSALSQTHAFATVPLTIVRDAKEIRVPVIFSPESGTSFSGASLHAPPFDARAALERALWLLEQAGVQSKEIAEARAEIVRALKSLEKPAFATAAGQRSGSSPRSVETSAAIIKRVEELSNLGKNPEEIQNVITTEFPEVSVRVTLGGSGAGDRFEVERRRSAHEVELRAQTAEKRQELDRLEAERAWKSLAPAGPPRSSPPSERVTPIQEQRPLPSGDPGAKPKAAVGLDVRCSTCSKETKRCASCEKKASDNESDALDQKRPPVAPPPGAPKGAR